MPDGSVAAEASGRYLKMSLDKIADINIDGDEWVSFEENLSVIDVPAGIFAED